VRLRLQAHGLFAFDARRLFDVDGSELRVELSAVLFQNLPPVTSTISMLKD